MILGVAVLGSFYLFPNHKQQEESGAPNMAPQTINANTVFKTLDGKQKKIRDLGNKVIFINFWASWCGPCLEEMPTIYKLYDKLKDKGLEILAVSMDEEPVEGLLVLQKKFGKPKFIVVDGRDSPLPKLFNISAIPVTAIIDKTGHVIYSESGTEDWSDPKSINFIEKYL